MTIKTCQHKCRIKEESLTFKKPGSTTAERLPNQHEAVRQRTVLLTQFLASHLPPVFHIFYKPRHRTIIEREKQTEIDAFVNGYHEDVREDLDTRATSRLVPVTPFVTVLDASCVSR
ncbi:uncharacterized protein B0T23DRAFT_51733 [Neurospora hispaniola]|uniref:Uncharacterized protein n=1 Tax=Neurospora hispaniola TaxID=588809 RepID=A0AAJ0MLS1_9PEZI|nr:hypothetical protein B0T23DRAFT_51733 [Neurospora hispaniola]